MRKSGWLYFSLIILIVGIVAIWAIRIWEQKTEAKIEVEKEKQATQIEEQYKISLANNKSNSKQLVLNGLNFANLSYYKLATIALEKVIEIDPNYRDGLVAYGSVVLKKCEVEKKCEKTELDKAKSALEHAREVDPLDPTVKKYLEIVDSLSDS